MKKTSLATKALLPVAASLALLSNPVAHAESTYGYSASGAAGATATARVNLQVNVPMLILLRVGSSGATVDTVTLTVAPSPGIPGGIAAGALAGGSNLASGWDGTAPVMAATASPANVTAYVWTNSVGGGSLNGTFSTPFTTGGLSGASIDVTSVAVANGGVAHPGSNLAAFAPTTFPANSLRSSTWAYSLTPAALGSVTAGTHSAQLTYTATSL